jgi:hypothetical protein
MPGANDLDTFQTAGIKQNAKLIFHVDFTGREVYSLLQILEARAVEAGDYLQCRQSVYFAERIRDQVKEQGF